MASIFTGRDIILTSTYKEQAYHLIKDAILYQRFKPDELYSQEDICQELGISRTPVREALLELQREHYISFARGRGIRVLSVTKSEAKAIMEMRINNEEFGARLAARRISEEQVRHLNALLEKAKESANCGDGTYMYHLDQEFHGAVVLAAGNEWLAKSVTELREHFLQFENKIAYDIAKTTEAVLQEHQAIYEAIAARDEHAAAESMRKHLVAAYRRTIADYPEEYQEQDN